MSAWRQRLQTKQNDKRLNDTDKNGINGINNKHTNKQNKQTNQPKQTNKQTKQTNKQPKQTKKQTKTNNQRHQHSFEVCLWKTWALKIHSFAKEPYLTAWKWHTQQGLATDPGRSGQIWASNPRQFGPQIIEIWPCSYGMTG